MPARLRHAGGAWQEVSRTFPLTTDGLPSQGQLIYVFADTKAGPRPVTLPPGEALRPVSVKITAEAEVGDWVSEKPSAMIELDDPRDLSLTWGQIGKGASPVGLEIVHYAGKIDLDFTEVLRQ